jgi:hypothetical protein
LLYTFSLNPLGDKKTLLRRVESLLFEKYLYKRSGDEELREISDIEIETLINSSKIEFSPKEQKHYSEWEAAIREGTQFFLFPRQNPTAERLSFWFIEALSSSLICREGEVQTLNQICTCQWIGHGRS